MSTFAFAFVFSNLSSAVSFFMFIFTLLDYYFLFTIFWHFLFTRLLDKQDILAPDQPYYGQGPPSVHSNQDEGRSYRQAGIVELADLHF